MHVSELTSVGETPLLSNPYLSREHIGLSTVNWHLHKVDRFVAKPASSPTRVEESIGAKLRGGGG